MQQIEIEVISPEASEARLPSPRDALSRHMARPHLGDQEHAIALTPDYPADEFLGADAARNVCASGSVCGYDISTPICRIPLGCCACATVSGHAAAAP